MYAGTGENAVHLSAAGLWVGVLALMVSGSARHGRTAEGARGRRAAGRMGRWTVLALGASGLADVPLQHLDGVKGIDPVVDQPAKGIKLRVIDW